MVENLIIINVTNSSNDKGGTSNPMRGGLCKMDTSKLIERINYQKKYRRKY